MIILLIVISLQFILICYLFNENMNLLRAKCGYFVDCKTKDKENMLLNNKIRLLEGYIKYIETYNR
jgi:hypothetical protein